MLIRNKSLLQMPKKKLSISIGEISYSNIQLYLRKKTYSFFYYSSIRADDLVHKLKMIEKLFEIAIETNFPKKILEDLKNIFVYIRQKYNNNRSFDNNNNYNYLDYEFYVLPHYEAYTFLSTMNYVVDTILHDRLISLRSIKTILGNFEESISPKMIHKILTWLKKTEPSKYGAIPRSIKENIINDLKELGIKINAHFLCKFIDNNNPIEFVKEWNIKTHKNGKRMKNSEIRQLFKNAFHKKEKFVYRSYVCMPALDSLPNHIENIIYSYLGW